VIFITSSAVLLAPVIHRFLHKFHLEDDGAEEDAGEEEKVRKKPGAGRIRPARSR